MAPFMMPSSSRTYVMAPVAGDDRFALNAQHPVLPSSTFFEAATQRRTHYSDPGLVHARSIQPRAGHHRHSLGSTSKTPRTTPRTLILKNENNKFSRRVQGKESKSNMSIYPTEPRQSNRSKIPKQVNTLKPAPKKRGRQKKPDRPEELADHQLQLGDQGAGALHRRAHECTRLLERNRLAATKCPNRKRDEVKDLELQERDAEDRHRYLSANIAQLMDDIYDLKSQLLQHTDCDRVLIQIYISQQARSFNDLSKISPPNFRGGGNFTSTACGTSTAVGSPGSMDTISSEAESMQTSWTSPFSQPTSSVTPRNTMLKENFEAYRNAAISAEESTFLPQSMSMTAPVPVSVSVPGVAFQPSSNETMSTVAPQPAPMENVCET